MICRDVIILISLCATCNGFWWSGSRPVEPPQPTIKQVPIGYFRAFTYQPLPFNPQGPNHYFTYQMSPKPFPPFMNWPQKSYAPVQPQGYTPAAINQQQFYAESVAPITVPAPMPPQSQNQLHGNLPVHSPSAPYQQAAALNNDQNYNQPTASIPSTSNPEPITTPSPAPPPIASMAEPQAQESVRQFQQPDQMNMQYYANAAATMPHIQFVPCMCPVSLAVSPEIVANKRSDEFSEMRQMYPEFPEREAEKINVQSPNGNLI